jgi:hypothetical protein
MCAHPGTDRLRVPGIDCFGGEIDGAHPRSGGSAQQRSQVARVAQPVEHEHERGRVVSSTGKTRKREDRQDALRRLHVTQAVEEPGRDDTRCRPSGVGEVTPGVVFVTSLAQ